jgi:hypothetical protein
VAGAATAKDLYPLNGGEGAEALVLRFPDIGPGYQVSDDSGCGIGVENASLPVRSLVLTHWPIKACEIQYEKMWRARKPGPARGVPFVSSTAYVFSTEEGARAGFQAAADLLGYSQGIERPQIFPRPERPPLGDEASVAYAPSAFALGSDHPGVAVFWRRGNVLATVFVVGRSEAKGKPIALALARRQDARIQKPTPLRPSDIDDSEVHLDDPRLPVPVYWLGRRFAPGHGLPALRYFDALLGDRRDPEWPGDIASLDYQRGRNGVGMTLWVPRRWARFQRSKHGRGFWSRPCARKRVAALRRGRAELFRSCGKRNVRYIGFVYLPGVVVDVGAYCLRCESGEGAYGSFKGLTAVVRGLHLRRR